MANRLIWTEMAMDQSDDPKELERKIEPGEPDHI
jgi:Protein of unknown function (DUF2934)